MPAEHQAEIVQAEYEAYARNALVQLRRVREGATLEEDHMRNRQLIVHWLIAHTTAIDVRRRDDRTFYVATDPAAFREGCGRLLADVQRIKSEGDYAAARALLDHYGVHFDPALRDEIVARIDRLNLPSYTAFVQPRLEPAVDAAGHIIDVRDLVSAGSGAANAGVFRKSGRGGGPAMTRRLLSGGLKPAGYWCRDVGGGLQAAVHPGGLKPAGYVLLMVLLLAGQTGGAQADARARLGAAVDPAIAALWSAYDMKMAMDHVRFIAQYWRLPGNAGYNASIDRVFHRLAAAGLPSTIEEYPTSGPAWDYSVGTLALVNAGKPDQIVVSKEKDHIALCINSFGTAPGGVVAPLVDVGRGTAQDYANKDLKGAVVLADQSPSQLWSRAVVTGGAIGVISASPPPGYINPDRAGGRRDAARSVGHLPVDERAVRRSAQGLRLQGVGADGRRRCASG